MIAREFDELPVVWWHKSEWKLIREARGSDENSILNDYGQEFVVDVLGTSVLNEAVTKGTDSSCRVR